MKRLLWLFGCVLAAGWTLDDYKTNMHLWDPAVPYTSMSGDKKICYYHPVSHNCAEQAIGKLLGITVNDATTWTAAVADCDSILEEELLYVEEVFTSVFNGVTFPTITDDNYAIGRKWSLMARVWILRYGHFTLATRADWQSFITALKPLTGDWSGVYLTSDHAKLRLGGSNEIALPSELAALCATIPSYESDCKILDTYN